MSKPAQRREATPDELVAINALQSVTFPVASWDKRFARSMSGMLTVTEKEVPQIWRLFKKYRRQINCADKSRLLAFAEEHAAIDFRKLNKMEDEQRRYLIAMQQGNNPPQPTTGRG